jgi:hypothetical protein
MHALSQLANRGYDAPMSWLLTALVSKEHQGQPGQVWLSLASPRTGHALAANIVSVTASLCRRARREAQVRGDNSPADRVTAPRGREGDLRRRARPLRARNGCGARVQA